MKFDFQNSTYWKLWDSNEGRQLLDMIVQDPDMIRANYKFAFQKFTVDPNITPTNTDGTASFISRMRELEMATMLHMRAPLGDTVTKDKKGIAYYTGVIPDFISDGFRETAMEREDKERRYQAMFGNDAFLIAGFVDQVQSLVDSADMTMSNLAAQILSKGYIKYEAGDGITGNIYKADIPKANFQKAGEKVWTDTDCLILDQIAKIEQDMKDSWGIDIAMQWEISYDMFHKVFLKNKQVIDLVKSHRFFNEQPITEKINVTEAMFYEAIGDYEGLSPIVIIEEKQNDGRKGIIHGWAENTAVLRPAGYAGVIRHADNLDSYLYTKYGNTLQSRVYTTTSNGLYTIANLTLPNGNLKEWQTHLMVQAIPSLDEFLYHVIVDTNTAGEGAKP